MRLVTFFILGLILITSCQSNVNQKKGISKGFIEFKEKSFSFGTLNEGDVVGHRFTFINTGLEPVLILNVEKSCGCTDVRYPKVPVKSGDSAFVELVFDTRGWSGRQVKQVKVLSNDSIGIRELRIWADIN
ncbi:DUF1573 domain-containing protein [Carboxylicivirga caseinilyticus]|uniref:DUF1573 domain-containing protein n=1 Tax=Carboxylicivirga caseinilyticus TaxID=3417572 RepID=UPI003D3405AA|nr:DUF1573 domain-containing protein [Marinilabiliaceae bacterium A049]